MSVFNDLSSLDLSALLVSRVCHDIISPVGAITNGLEVLDEEGNEDMADFAMDLIRKSARHASAKLQFARLAFGAAGSAGASIDTGDAQEVAIGYMSTEKANLEWNVPRLLLPKNQVKLILNLLLLTKQCVPRGGTITISMDGDESAPNFVLKAEGTNARIPQDVSEILSGQEPERIDAHTVQPIYAVLLAAEAGVNVELLKDGDAVICKANTQVAESV